MLCALTKPVPDEATDFGAMFPLIVEMTFIFEVEIVDVGVSLACTTGARKERAPAVPAATMATSALLI
jgi:hypothetical protein